MPAQAYLPHHQRQKERVQRRRTQNMSDNENIYIYIYGCTKETARSPAMTSKGWYRTQTKLGNFQKVKAGQNTHLELKKATPPGIPAAMPIISGCPYQQSREGARSIVRGISVQLWEECISVQLWEDILPCPAKISHT